jgi:hypothetical protein
VNPDGTRPREHHPTATRQAGPGGKHTIRVWDLVDGKQIPRVENLRVVMMGDPEQRTWTDGIPGLQEFKVDREQSRKKGQRTESVGSRLIALACRRYPADTRDDRCREFTTELRYVLADAETPRPLRTIHGLLYAADHIRGALTWSTRHSDARPEAGKSQAPASARLRFAPPAALCLVGLSSVLASPNGDVFSVGIIAALSGGIWLTRRAVRHITRQDTR